jgi:hypothetical protein
MKKIYIFILLSFCLAPTFAQVPSDCTIPQILSGVYERDIKNMVIRRMYENQHADTSLIAIPQNELDTVEEGLAAIFNATSIPQRDSIFNLYCVHDNTTMMQVYNGLLVQVDTSYAWTDAWQNLVSITGNPTVDSLLVNYDIIINQFYNFSFGNYALLHTDSLWNTYALIDSLETIPGIIYAEPDAIIGGAGKIIFSRVGNARYYDFYFEFNDCFDGCDNYRDWKYKVNPDCSVEYLGYEDWGAFGIQPLPAPLNCNVFVAVQEKNNEINFQISPNPANDMVIINWNNEFKKKVDLVLYNIQGTEVKRVMNAGNKEIKIDISRLPAGTYVLNLYEKNQVIATGKIIRE